MADPLWGRLRGYVKRRLPGGADRTDPDAAGSGAGEQVDPGDVLDRRAKDPYDAWTRQISIWGAIVEPETIRERHRRRSRPDVAATIQAVRAIGLADVDVNPCPSWHDGEPVVIVAGRSAAGSRPDVQADAEQATVVARNTFPVPAADRMLVRVRAPGVWIEHWSLPLVVSRPAGR
ncbi:MAG: hypothetical protein L0Y54_15125 [Sporichthyaceae bacterium]|nr:hypothetical protein [Sporichthyaceae bacterium]